MKNRSIVIFAVLFLSILLVLPGCSKDKKGFELQSAAFLNGERIPDKYCFGGIGERQNISLPFNWVNPPEDTKSFALIMYNLGCNHIRWVVFNIPADCNSIAENASGKNMPKGSIELNNYRRTQPPYHGPEPEPGDMVFDYTAVLYALNTVVDNIGGYKSYMELNEFLEGKVLAQAEITGTQSKKRLAPLVSSR